jgi:hypothetical protein
LQHEREVLSELHEDPVVAGEGGDRDPLVRPVVAGAGRAELFLDFETRSGGSSADASLTQNAIADALWGEPSATSVT